MTRRFMAVDPMADATDSYGTYHYAMDNPVMFNDPMGDTAPKTIQEVVRVLSWGKSGGYWNSNNADKLWLYGDDATAIYFTQSLFDVLFKARRKIKNIKVNLVRLLKLP